MEKVSKFSFRNILRPIILVFVICIVLFLLSLLAKNSDVFMFWGDSIREAQATAANNMIRNTDNFNWGFIFTLTIVLYIYFSELKNKNYKGLVAGLSLYGVHWIYEIINGVIQSSSGFALWTVSPESTSFILLIGVSWELSMMFAVAGIVMSKLLPEDKNLKILGINNRVLFIIVNATFLSVFEIFLAGTPAFIWTYSWWGTIPVFLTTYIPFFMAAFLVPDAPIKIQKRFIFGVWGLVALLLVVLIPLGII